MSQPPLCVDFDRSLLKTDSLHEAFVLALRTRPTLFLFAAVAFIRGGRTGLKTYLAANLRPNIALFPFNEQVIDFIRQEKATGRSVFLVTGTSQVLATAANDHLKLFDDCFGSHAKLNLKGEDKAEFLVVMALITSVILVMTIRFDLTLVSSTS